MASRWNQPRWSGPVTDPVAILQNTSSLQLDYLFLGRNADAKQGVALSAIGAATFGNALNPDEVVVANPRTGVYPALDTYYSIPGTADAVRTAPAAVNYTTESLAVYIVFRSTAAGTAAQLVSNVEVGGGVKGFAIEVNASNEIDILAAQDVGNTRTNLTTSAPLNDNTWQTVLAVFNRSTAMLYGVTDNMSAANVTTDQTVLPAGTLTSPSAFSIGAGRLQAYSPLSVAMVALWSGSQVDYIDGRQAYDLLQELRLVTISEQTTNKYL